MSGFAGDPRASAIDEVVTRWDGVRGKNVFGHRGWVRGGTMVGFIADDGVAVKLVGSMDAEAVMARDGVALFAYDGKPMKGWPVLPVRDDAELDAAIALLHDAYEAVSG